MAVAKLPQNLTQVQLRFLTAIWFNAVQPQDQSQAQLVRINANGCIGETTYKLTDHMIHELEEYGYLDIVCNQGVLLTQDAINQKNEIIIAYQSALSKC